MTRSQTWEPNPEAVNLRASGALAPTGALQCCRAPEVPVAILTQARGMVMAQLAQLAADGR
jgi:hypothetical protein